MTPTTTMIVSKYKYDVFISHNKAQKPLVRQIVNQWRSLGLKVFFDEDNIDPGEYVAAALSRGVEDSHYIVLMITPEAMAGQWIAMECCSAVQEDPDSENRRLIPVLLEPTPRNNIPIYIKCRNYLDFTDRQTRRDRYRYLLKFLGIEEDRLPGDLPPVDGVVPPGLTPRQEYLAEAMIRKRRQRLRHPAARAAPPVRSGCGAARLRPERSGCLLLPPRGGGNLRVPPDGRLHDPGHVRHQAVPPPHAGRTATRPGHERDPPHRVRPQGRRDERRDYRFFRG